MPATQQQRLIALESRLDLHPPVFLAPRSIRKTAGPTVRPSPLVLFRHEAATLEGNTACFLRWNDAAALFKQAVNELLLVCGGKASEMIVPAEKWGHKTMTNV